MPVFGLRFPLTQAFSLRERGQKAGAPDFFARRLSRTATVPIYR